MSETAILAAAQAFYAAGISVVPAREDGSKRPKGGWKKYQHERASRDQMAAWFRGADPCQGLGAVLGEVSGNAEMLEFEGQAVRSGVWDEYCALATLEGDGELIDRITDGYLEDTPSGGIHILMKVEGGDPLGNTKLASSSDGEVLVETRGEGGYVILAPSNGGVHPDGGSWKLVSGGPDQIATVTVAERDSLYDIARRLDQRPAVAMSTPSVTPAPSGDDPAPWDLFDRSSDQVLEAAGFVFESESPDHRSGGVARHYTRPGKDKREGSSASVWGDGRCTIFSTSVDVPPEVTDRRRLSPWQLHVMLNHRGDFSAAAKAERQSQSTGRVVELDEEAEPLTITNADLPPGFRLYQPGDLGGYVEPLGEEAYHGALGALAKGIEGRSEATPAASMGAALTMMSIRNGRGVRLRTASVEHPSNLFLVVVGPSATARKGIAESHGVELMENLDLEFARSSMMGGIRSGAMLADLIADPEYDKEGELKSGRIDQRLLLLDSEFSETLKVTQRKGENLSEVLRNGFDQRRAIENHTRTHRSVRSSHHHLGVFGSITPDELEREFPTVGATNGFGNRIVWCWSDSGRIVPDADHDLKGELSKVIKLVAQAIPTPRIERTFAFTSEAREMWNEYRTTDRDRTVPSELAPMMNRASDLVARIALNYALIDGSTEVAGEHLAAGMAWQRYSESTVSAVLGGMVRDDIAVRILDALRRGGRYVTALTDLHNLFGRNALAGGVTAAVEQLEQAGLVHTWKGPSTSKGGRRPVLAVAVTRTERKPE